MIKLINIIKLILILFTSLTLLISFNFFTSFISLLINLLNLIKYIFYFSEFRKIPKTWSFCLFDLLYLGVWQIRKIQAITTKKVQIFRISLKYVFLNRIWLSFIFTGRFVAGNKRFILPGKNVDITISFGKCDIVFMENDEQFKLKVVRSAL